MTISYSGIAQNLIKLVGGSANIISISNCMTRLRLKLKDMSKPDDEAVKQVYGVNGIIRSGNEYQIVIGAEVFLLSEEFGRMGHAGWEYRPGEYLERFHEIVHPSDSDAFIRPTLQKIRLHAPLTGQLLPLHEAPDSTFASGLLGKGAVILPYEGKVIAPCDGIVSATMETGHAIGMYADDGVKLLIHIGVDTNQLDGRYFTSYVKLGDHVSQGELLINFDIDGIKNQGYPVHTSIIITNSEDYVIIKPVNAEKISMGETFMTII